MIFCCELMEINCTDERVQLYYNPVMDEYYIPLKRNAAKQLIRYCPWCATKLPDSVRDKYFELLDDDQLENPPLEFQSDAWWKNRNL